MSGRYGAWLVGSAVSYALLHHLGLLPDGLGAAPEGTRWTDWLDLAVPWLVLGPPAVALHAAGATTRTWVLFGAGCIAYASGHGIHLAANSVANADPGPTAHVWDEVVGHLVWYLGVALVVAALARTMADRPPAPWWGHVLALPVALTWATNSLGGVDTLPLSVAGLVLAAAYGWRQRTTLAGVLWPSSLAALLLLATAAPI